MANQPINLGTAPLGDDGDTVRQAFTKVNENIAELYSTKANTADARLTDSREWTAETVPQAEAEAGTATTRRAWTAQRVRQAIVAWWNSATSTFGRGFVAAADASAGRTALGLGNAATRTALGTTGALYSRDSILGTVSQYGGIPTGAIIERGSNANGEYVKYADGTLICTNRVTINRVTFPGGKQNHELLPAASFVGDYAVYKSVEFYNGLNGAFPHLYTFGTTMGRFVNSGEQAYDEVSWPPQIGTFTANSEIQTLIAIGRWY